MKEIFEKLSSYNIFNYLFPGFLFFIFVQKFTSYKFIQEDVFLNIIICYFIGLVISRFGSLIVEPILKGLKFLKFESYNKFTKYSGEDFKLEILSEVNNMYRTICSLFLVLLIIKLYEAIETYYPFMKNLSLYLMFSALFIMFLFSYRKQTKYITDRINYKGNKK